LERVVFEPWIGGEYMRGGFGHLRILVLGESHYDEGYAQSCRTTAHVVERYLRGEDSRPYFEKIGTAFVGQAYRRGIESRAHFWNAVAFYNYIQEFMGQSPGRRPTAAQLKDAERPFIETLVRIAPHLVVATGFAVWDAISRIPSTVEVLAAPVLADHRRCELRTYELPSSTRVFAGYTKHPSRGFNAGDWRQWIHAYVEAVTARVKEMPYNRAFEQPDRACHGPC
jgi:hypothetical protein